MATESVARGDGVDEVTRGAFSQRLKPLDFAGFCGTARAVPLQKANQGIFRVTVMSIPPWLR